MAASSMGPRTRVLVATVATTVLVTVAAYALPVDHAATGVGFVFLAAVYLLVLRGDTSFIRAHGLSLGGILEPRTIRPKEVLRAALSACAWAFGIAAVVFPLFWVWFVLWWHPAKTFSLVYPGSVFDEVLGQLVVIALPEEAFYRGYLQSSLDRLWGSKPGALSRSFKLFGAQIGWSIPVTSAVFALGHLMTEPNPQRLAVFFPSLLFGWLRNKTGGIGAAILLHAMANIFSSTLARGYGLFH